MYKEKKVSKFALICCSFLIALSTMLAINPTWLNNVYGSTLCASSTAPTIDDSYFNYKDSNFLNKFDAYVDYITFSNGNNGSGSVSFWLVNGSSMPTYSNMPTTFYGYSTNALTGVTTLVSTTFSTTFQSAYGLTYINFTTTTTSYSATQITNLFVINNNSTYYIVCGSSLYSKHIAYMEGVSSSASSYQDGYNAGYSDGEGIGYNTGYYEGLNTGFTNGQNSVLNHPHDYDLYTQEEFEDEYDRGYQIGQDDILVDPNEYDLYNQQQYDNNYNVGYNAGETQGYIDGYNGGFEIGINTVVTDPNDYDLYTSDQYHNNYLTGYRVGFSEGKTDGLTTTYSFKNLIFAVVDVPVQTVRSLFNFDLLGFNLFNFFAALLTACVLILLIKLVMKSK